VCHGIKANPDTVLHDLYLDNNGITDASDLADLLKTVPSVTKCVVFERVWWWTSADAVCVRARDSLELQDNRLGDAGAKELTEAIKVSRLGSLNLANNSASPPGGDPLSSDRACQTSRTTACACCPSALP
jgi:Leucine-rich repeat (LRR) protein